MAYSILANDIVEITFQGVVNYQTTMTVLHYYVLTAPPADDALNQLTQLNDDIAASTLWTEYLGLIGTDWQSRYIVSQVVDPIRRPKVVKYLLAAGTGGGAAETANVSAVLTKRTDWATKRKLKQQRGGVGGVHIPAIPRPVYAAGLLLAGYRTLLNAWGAKVLLTVSIGGTGVLVPCLYHKGQLAPQRFDDLTQANAQDTVRVMRRRTVGLGI